MNYSKKILATILPVILLSFTSCKKDNEEETATPQTPATDECSFSANAIVLDGTQAAIIKSNCFSPFAGTYYSEHMSDTSSTSPKGVVMVFNGAAPAVGDYTVTPNASSIAAGQVFVEYYNTATSWHGTAGTIKVTDSGSSKVYTFCKISCTDGSTTKVVSVRATCF
ncbi:MAG TPA: hypothetical protein PKN75_07050 [Bacteroidia bacterium]|nr:hypothetical protein [Bacteroidia bacterium]HNU33333.1 hypothetical protein [Bacteroidia bacterium]